MYIYVYIYNIESNVRSGLINTPLLINLLPQKMQFKKGGPPGLINRLART